MWWVLCLVWLWLFMHPHDFRNLEITQSLNKFSKWKHQRSWLNLCCVLAACREFFVYVFIFKKIIFLSKVCAGRAAASRPSVCQWAVLQCVKSWCHPTIIPNSKNAPRGQKLRFEISSALNHRYRICSSSSDSLIICWNVESKRLTSLQAGIRSASSARPHLDVSFLIIWLWVWSQILLTYGRWDCESVTLLCVRATDDWLTDDVNVVYTRPNKELLRVTVATNQK
jgi:hypothetical protein